MLPASLRPSGRPESPLEASHRAARPSDRSGPRTTQARQDSPGPPRNLMFEALTDRLSGVIRNLTGQGRLSADNVRESLREVRRALLEADVQLGVARDFIARVEARAVGEDVLRSLTPGQQVVGIVHDELVSLLGKTPVTLANSSHVPEVVLLAGLQGSGKTTFAGKLAKWMGSRGKRVLLASADVYRPAAIDQLETLAPL